MDLAVWGAAQSFPFLFPREPYTLKGFDLQTLETVTHQAGCPFGKFAVSFGVTGKIPSLGEHS